MRFARHATIFRGPLDAGPVAGVLFLLLLFVLLFSLVYTPGVLVKLDSVAGPAQLITVTGRDEIIFEGKTNNVRQLDSLRADIENAPPTGPFELRVQPGANQDLVQRVRALFQVRPPLGDNLVGTDNATVVVAVNLRGQCFFENRPVQDQELKTVLRRRLQEAALASKKLTMILWADEAAQVKVVSRLELLARDVGITEILLAERPVVFGPRMGAMP